MSGLPKSVDIRGYLPPGIHPTTIEELQERFGTSISKIDFPDIRREHLFAGYQRLIEALRLVGLPAEQWIGGSFIAFWGSPNDIDLVNYCDVVAYEALSPEIKAMINRYFQGEETAKHCHCDSYFVPLPPPQHRLNDDFMIVRAYWEKLLGHDKTGRPKGIASIIIDLPYPIETKEASNAQPA